MNITVLGAGAMGSLFGGILAECGHDVTLVDVNQAHLDAIRTFGLRLQTDQGDRHLRGIQAVRPDQASRTPELLIVFTKTLHTSAAMAGIEHLLGENTYVLSLQNGLGNVEKLTRFVPVHRILIGITTWPADMAGPGHVHSHGAGSIRLMSADGINHTALGSCVQALNSAGLNCVADPDVWSAIWEKVAFNAALNSICAVARCTVDELGKVPQVRDLALDIVDEVVSVAQATGVTATSEKPAAEESPFYSPTASTCDSTTAIPALPEKSNSDRCQTATCLPSTWWNT